METFLLALLGIVYYTFFYQRTRSVLNPIGIFLASWCFTASVSSLALLENQHKFSVETMIVIIAASISIFVAGLIFVPKTHVKISYNKILNKKQRINVSERFLNTTKIIFLISVVCMFFEWRKSGFFLPGLSFIPSYDKKSIISSISGVHYGTILMPVCALFAFFELLFTKKYRKINIMIFLFSVVFNSYFRLISRGDLIFIFLGCLFILNYRYRLRIRYIIGSLVALLIIFVLVAVIRIPSSSLVFSSFGESFFNQVFSPIYTYISYGFQNLQMLIELNAPIRPSLPFSFKFMWDLLGQRENLNLILFETDFFNSTTFIYPFYHDWKLLGVVIFSFLIGCYVAFIQNKLYYDKRYVLLVAITQKAIIMAFFGNYFFVDNVSIWLYLVVFFTIHTLSKSENKNLGMHNYVGKTKRFF